MNYSKLILLAFSLLTFSASSQSLTWTGIADIDFFNEQNWVVTGTANIPAAGAINPSIAIGYDLVIKDTELDISGDGMLAFSTSSQGISLDGASLTMDGLTTGRIALDKTATLIFKLSNALGAQTSLDIADAKSWVKFIEVDPNTVQSSYLSKIKSNNTSLSIGTTVRINQYYFKGSLVRLIKSNHQPLMLYDEINLVGTSFGVAEFNIYNANSLGQFDNLSTSFKLERGYVMTMADLTDGKGKSQVFIASEEDLLLNLSSTLNNKASFIRVMPWNWVTKKGGASFTEGINTSWTYNWGNGSNSLANLEYAPMAWGGGGASLASVAEQIQKKNVTHMMGFNESDNCDDQSGQYTVNGEKLCVVSNAVAQYSNLMGTGLRLVSPSPREGGPKADGWLTQFRDLAETEDVRMDVIGVHWYDWGGNPVNTPNENAQNVFNRFKNYLTDVHDRYQKPIWITEFNANPNRDSSVNIAFIKLALPYLESLEFVERYCVFEPNKDVSIANNVNPTAYYEDNGDLSPFGAIYKNQVSTPAIPEATYYTEGTVVIEINDNSGGGGSTIPNDKLYWEENGTTSTSGVLASIPLADDNNIAANTTDWVEFAGSANQQLTTTSQLILSGYPKTGSGNAFRTSTFNAAGAFNQSNKEYIRRIGNSGETQTLYMSMVLSVFQLRAAGATFPIGFAEVLGDAGSTTRTWGSRLFINNLSGNTNVTSGNFQFGVSKNGPDRFFDSEKTYGANGAEAGDAAIFVVLKLTMDNNNANANDVLELYTSTTFPNEEPTNWDLSVTTGDDLMVNAVFIREKMDQGGSDHFTDFGNIRVANSWNGLFASFYENEAWSIGTPNANITGIVNANITLNEDLIAKNLLVKAGITVTVNPEVTIDVKGDLKLAGDFIMQSGASLLVYDGNTIGEVTINRNSSFTDEALRYSFIGSPVKDMNIGDLNAGYHYTYNSSNDTYTSFNGVMELGEGYTSAGKQALEFVGVPNTGSINVTLDNTGNKFNFIANPYTAAISRSSFVSGNSNITGAIYIWDDGGSNQSQRPNTDFITITNAGAVLGGSSGSGATFNQNIGSAQGFLVQANAVGAVTFTEAMRVSGNNADDNFFRKAEQLNKIMLEIKGNDATDQTLLAFTDEGSWKFDRMWDATKFLNKDRLGLYSKMNDQILAIQTLPSLTFNETIEVPIGVEIIATGDYVFSITEMVLPEGFDVMLNDQRTGQQINLTETEAEVTLSLEDKNRFTLSVQNKASILGLEELNQSLVVYAQVSELQIQCDQFTGNGELTIYDLGGSIYYQANHEFDESGKTTLTASQLKRGVYIVRIDQANISRSAKFYY